MGSEPCPKCGVGQPVLKCNSSPAQWLECNSCGFALAAWEQCWNELSAARHPDPTPLIERLTAERDEAREALKPFAREADNHDRPDIEDTGWFGGDLTFGDLRRARALIEKEPQP